MTQEVVDSQIEDIGRVVDAAEAKRPMFVIGSAPGSGKTFVLGGVIRELRNRGFKKLVYVTQNQNLISQVKGNLGQKRCVSSLKIVLAPPNRWLPRGHHYMLVVFFRHQSGNVTTRLMGTVWQRCHLLTSCQ